MPEDTQAPEETQEQTPEQLELQGGEPDPNEPEPEDDAKNALERELQQTREALAELRGRVDAQAAQTQASQQQTQEAKPTYTRAQLQAAVDEGKIDEATRDDILYQQAQEQILAKVEERFAEREEREKASAAASKVLSELTEYKENIPDIMREGSDIRSRVFEEIQNLQRLFGEPKNEEELNKMQLQAARTILGPVSKIREKTREKRQTAQETGGSGDGQPPAKGPANAPKNMNDRLKSYYEGQIQKGVYKGWDDPTLKKEMEYVH